jgi:O-antigen ligase
VNGGTTGTVSTAAVAADVALRVMLGSLGFFLPFSTAGVSLSMAALLLVALPLAPRLWASRPWREPTVAIGLLLLAYIAAHTLATTGWTVQSGNIVNKYHELLMLPVLLALFRAVTHNGVFIRALAAGAVLCGVAYWLAPFMPRLLQGLDERRISAGYILAVCSFVLLLLSRHERSPWLWRIAAGFLALTVLFRIEGRTGHLVLLVLMAIAAWLETPSRWRLAATLSLPLAGLALALLSPAVQTRLHETATVIRNAQPDGETSTGIRIAIAINGAALAREAFPVGVGYARYGEVHERFVRQRHGADPVWAAALKLPWVGTRNPHNEYLMQLAGGGIVALLLFCAWLLAPLAKGMTTGSARIAFGATLAFGVGCLFNSLLLDFVEGHFHVALLAWLLAREAERGTAAA